MREIVLDTETTGLDPLRGDRLVEIGCIEIINRMPTGQTFHRYINPERDMPAEAFAVHGLSTEFLASKPLFTEVVEEFLEFIADAPLVIHNASFDIGFIRCYWPAASIPACRTGSTISARAMRSTIPAAPSTVHCSTRNCSPRSIST
jgi:DNA polymerase III epsilon subunit